ncbi:hypothetical protein F4X10_09090 [Candidatus Poribacteria bacterium]|nr:hypothetical protein [Candidatus Poribacteria bacterium]
MHRISSVKTQKYIYWQDETMFIGYLEAYPDYWTQGETIEALEENLLDIYDVLAKQILKILRD